MSRTCIRDFKESAADLMDKDKAEALLEDIRARAAIRQRENLMPKARAFKTTVDDIIEERKKNSRLARKQQYLNLLRFNENKNIIDSFRVEGRKSAGAGLLANIGGIIGDIIGGRMSADAIRKAMMNQARGKLLTRLNKIPGGMDLFKSKANEADLAKEMELPGSTGNKKIQEVAKEVKAIYEEYRNLLNSVGADIKFMPNYIAKQKHNAEKMSSPTGSFYKDQKLKLDLIKNNPGKERLTERLYAISRERWKTFIRPLLDEEKTFKDVDDQDRFLNSVYDNILEGHHGRPFVTDPESARQFRVPSPGNYAKKLGSERVLHFKQDGESTLAYIRRYGDGSMQQSIINTVTKMGSDYGLISKMGTNPMAMFFRMVRHIKDNYSDEDGNLSKGLSAKIDKARIQMGHLMNEYARPWKSLGGKMLQGLTIYDMMKSLSLVTLKSIPDLAIRGSKMTEYGDSYLTTYRNFIKDFFGEQKKQNVAISDLTHAWSNSVLANFYSRAQGIDSPFHAAGKMQQMFFKLNGLTHWDNMMRSGGVGSIARALGRVKNTEWESLPDSVRRNLSNYGILKDEWDMTRKAPVNTPIVNNVITPDSSLNVSRELIARSLGKADEELSDFEENQFRNKLNLKWSTFFQNELDDLQIQPGIATTAALVGQDKSNNPAGAIRRLVAMYKHFSVEATKRTLGRMIYGQGAENIRDAIFNGKGSRMQLLNFMVHSMVLSYIGLTAAAIAQGKTPPVLSDPKTFLDVFLDSGALGMYGSMLSGDYSKYGSNFIADLTGPVGRSVNTMAKLISQGKDDSLQGKIPFTRKSVVHDIVGGNKPFLNLPFIKMAINYGFLYSYMEVHNPGYLENMQRKLQKETGQSYFWLPK